MPRLRRIASIAACATLLAMLAAPAGAHEAHKKKKQEETPAITASADTGSVADSAIAAPSAPDVQEPFEMPPVGEMMLHHVHNKIVHFPIALGLMAALLYLVARRKPELETAARWLVWAAALAAIAAYFTGKAQEEPFEGDAKEWLVELHEKLGIASAVGLLLWGAATFWVPARRFMPWMGLIVAGAILVTAAYGGLVAHG